MASLVANRLLAKKGVGQIKKTRMEEQEAEGSCLNRKSLVLAQFLYLSQFSDPELTN